MWNDRKLRELFLNRIPLIDVRAPIEFQRGAVPNSVNLPIMEDKERELVGTCYKEQGQQKAISLGHKLVSGSIKEKRIQRWRDYVDGHPEAQVFCFRGGMRSQLSCEWMERSKQPIPGGYKKLRRFFLSWLEEAPLPNFIRIGGPTGSSKTDFIHDFKHIDLEKLAHHRGSAFGRRGPQPSQITFENHLALDIMRLKGKPILVEDESAVLGQVVVPKRIFQHMRQSPMYVLEVSLEDRVKTIFKTYVQNQADEFFLNSLEKIQKGLGGVLYQKIHSEMKSAFRKGCELEDHKQWIAPLLCEYYDKHYARGIERHSVKVIGRGNAEKLSEILNHNIQIGL